MFFSISFRFGDKTYTATVQKQNTIPVRFFVKGITPYLSIVPLELTYESRVEEDSLVYHSFTTNQSEVLTLIGEAIFKACEARRINVHK